MESRFRGSIQLAIFFRDFWKFAFSEPSQNPDRRKVKPTTEKVSLMQKAVLSASALTSCTSRVWWGRRPGQLRTLMSWCCGSRAVPSLGGSRCDAYSLWYQPSSNGELCDPHIVWWVLLVCVRVILQFVGLIVADLAVTVWCGPRFARRPASQGNMCIFTMKPANVNFEGLSLGPVASAKMVAFEVQQPVGRHRGSHSASGTSGG